MLRENIRRVRGAIDLGKSEISSLKTVLDPEIRHMEVPDLAKPTAAADADCRRGISEEVKVQGDAKISSRRLQSQ